MTGKTYDEHLQQTQETHAPACVCWVNGCEEAAPDGLFCAPCAVFEADIGCVTHGTWHDDVQRPAGHTKEKQRRC